MIVVMEEVDRFMQSFNIYVDIKLRFRGCVIIVSPPSIMEAKKLTIRWNIEELGVWRSC